MTEQPITKPFIFDWTGRDAAALRSAVRKTQEQLAEYLDVSVRTVSRWDTDGTARISNRIQELLDVAYERLTETQVRRFLHALQSGPSAREVTAPVVMAAEMALMQARINELQTQLDAKESRS